MTAGHNGSVTPPTTVSCEIAYDVTVPAEFVLQVGVARRDSAPILEERLTVTGAGESLDATEVPGPEGGRQHRVFAPVGRLVISYEASVARPSTAAVDSTDAAAPPGDRIAALRPSRYCPSDRLGGFAIAHFGHFPEPADRVRAICDHVASYLAYEPGMSDSLTDAADTLLASRGAGRDFAHLVVACCRAVEVPARVAAVYAPGLSPMDFHLVVETALPGWSVWDATRLAPRGTLVRIATGRDAADTEFATILSGRAELTDAKITAVAGDHLPTDDHRTLVPLR
jgi:transglutaminase-like putative cysteine protease